MKRCQNYGINQNPIKKNRVKAAAAVQALFEQFNTSASVTNGKLHYLQMQFNKTEKA